MNARLAIQESERLTNHLFNDVKYLSVSKGETLTEALNFIIGLKRKLSKNDTQKTAWDIRGKKVEKMINMLNVSVSR
jgi:hypothetical protein